MALVQSTSKTVTGVDGTTLAYTSNLTAGNLCVLTHVHWFNSDQTISTPTATSHTFTGIGTAQQGGDAKAKLRSFYEENTAAGACTVTFDASSTNTGDFSLSIAEFNGMLTSGALDKNAQAGPTNGTAVDSGATATTAQANELIYAAMTFDGATTTITANSHSYTDLVNDGQGSLHMPICTKYRTVAAAAAYNGQFTLAAARDWLAHVVTFKESGGGGGKVTKNYHPWTLGVNLGIGIGLPGGSVS